MTVESTQAQALSLLQAAYDRAHVVVDSELLALIERRTRATLMREDVEDVPADPAGRSAMAIVDQMLMDVSQMDDATVTTADQYFNEGGLADFVMVAYIIEARTRLAIAAQHLWPEREAR